MDTPPPAPPPLEDLRQWQAKADAHGFAFVGEVDPDHLPFHPAYGQRAWHRKGFEMFEHSGSDCEEEDEEDLEQQAASRQHKRKETYKVGTYVSVNMPSVAGFPADAGASSIAVIEGVLEDAQHCCHVGVLFFYRPGQVHVGMDLEMCSSSSCGGGAVTGGRAPSGRYYEAQLFKQQRTTRAAYPYTLDHGRHAPLTHEAVERPDGSFVELLPAACINYAVTVHPYKEVMSRFREPGWSEHEALARFDAAFPDREASGARRSGFWWRFLFDQSVYSYATDPEAVGEEQAHVPLLDPTKCAMADVFCGAGTVALAARSVGFSVALGVDSNVDAMGSFMLNTADARHPGDGRTLPFNPEGSEARRSLGVLGKVEDFIKVLGPNRGLPDGAVVPPIAYMHFSPPCQDISSRKPKKLRTFNGRALMAIPELVERLQPAFVTLEEVPGFLFAAFQADQVHLAGQQPSGGDSSQAEPGLDPGDATGAGEDEEAGDVGSCEDEGGSDEDGLGALQAAAEVAQAARADMDTAAQQEHGGGGGGDGGDTVYVRPFLLVVPQLLALGYQVRLCLLNAAHYGAPQSRWRLFMFAARVGYALPEVPRPRYAAPLRQCNAVDPTLLPRSKPGPDGGSDYASWGDLLTAEQQDVLEKQSELAGALLPHVTLAEAIGDLPPIMGGWHRRSSSGSGSSCGGSTGGWGRGGSQHQATAAGGDLHDCGSQQQQQQSARRRSSEASLEQDSDSPPHKRHANSSAAGGAPQVGQQRPDGGGPRPMRPDSAGHSGQGGSAGAAADSSSGGAGCGSTDDDDGGAGASLSSSGSMGGGHSSSDAGDPRLALHQAWQSGVAHLEALAGAPLSRLLALDPGEQPWRRLPALGYEGAAYDPRQGVLLCQVPAGGAEGVATARRRLRLASAFAEFCRAPHWPGQATGAFRADVLLGHRCSVGETFRALRQLQLEQQQGRDPEPSRMDPFGLVGTVLSHNNVGNACLHFAEPRLATTRERARGQTLPDWMLHCGPLKEVERQIGNAVPYTTAAEVAASVWEAATGQQARRPPDLVGPSPSGVGLPPGEVAAYQAWLAGAASYNDRLGACRIEMGDCLLYRPA